MKLRNLIMTVVLSIVCFAIFEVNGATVNELKSKKREVANLFANYQKYAADYEDVQSKQMFIQNKLGAIEKEIDKLKSDQNGFKNAPMNSTIIKALLEVTQQIEQKDAEYKAKESELIAVENRAKNILVQVDNAEKRYKKANRTLNQMIDQTVDHKVADEISKFESPVRASEREQVSCSRNESVDDCEQRGYDKATGKIQDSKQLITSKSVVQDFELESDYVEKFSRNRLSDVKKSVVSEDYNPQSRSIILIVEVTASVSAAADQALIDKFREKLSLEYSVYRFVEGAAMTTLDDDINNALAGKTAQAKPQAPVQPNINVVLDTLFTQGLKHINLENFQGPSQSAFAIAREMASINLHHERTQMLLTMLDGGISIKAKEYSVSNKGAEGKNLVLAYQALQTEIGVTSSHWIPQYLAATPQNGIRSQNKKIQQLADESAKKLSSKEIKSLLTSARYLIRKDKYFSPASSNAYDKVKLVLDYDSNNSKAKEYYNKIFEDAAEDAVDMAEDGDYDEAREMLNAGLAKVAGESRLKAALNKVLELESQPKKSIRRAVGGF